MFDHKGQWFLVSKVLPRTGKQYIVCDEVVLPELFRNNWQHEYSHHTIGLVLRITPNANDVQVSTKDGDFLYSQETSPCLMCKRPAHWVEMNFEARICSDECIQQLNLEYSSYV